jgi:hypothetical protein
MSKTSFLSLSLLALTLSLASCGGGPISVTVPGDAATFTATASASTAVNLTWSAASGAAAYTLERKTNTGTYAEIARNLDANTTTYTDTGLTPSTSYTYRLKASNSAGSSAGIERSVVTPAPGDRSFDLSVTPGALTLNVGRAAPWRSPCSVPPILRAASRCRWKAGSSVTASPRSPEPSVGPQARP